MTPLGLQNSSTGVPEYPLTYWVSLCSVGLMTLGEYLKDKRQKMRQTQAQAAQEVGVTVKTWRMWERGGEPYAGKLLRIARWAGVGLGKLGPYLEHFSKPPNVAGPST